MKGNGDFSIGSKVWSGTSKVLEEMGELQQVMGKLIATAGEEKHWDGSNLKERLKEEMADVQAAILFFQIQNFSEEDIREVVDRRMKKLDVFLGWHTARELSGGG